MYIAIAFIVMLLMIIGYLVSNQKKEYWLEGCYKKDRLLTKNELVFYKQLERILDKKYTVMFQTRIADLFIISGKIRKENYSRYLKIFNIFSRKTVDFVILDENLRIKCAIELDDYSHNKPKRIDRDKKVEELFNYIRTPLVRYQITKNYKFDKLLNVLNPEQIANKDMQN